MIKPLIHGKWKYRLLVIVDTVLYEYHWIKDHARNYLEDTWLYIRISTVANYFTLSYNLSEKIIILDDTITPLWGSSTLDQQMLFDNQLETREFNSVPPLWKWSWHLWSVCMWNIYFIMLVTFLRDQWVHWGRDKMVVISQTTFSNARFNENYEFR